MIPTDLRELLASAERAERIRLKQKQRTCNMIIFGMLMLMLFIIAFII